jgi:predicted ester cyclase
MFKTNRTAMPDMKLEPQLVLVNGRNILAVVLTTGTHSGPLTTPMGEVAATNKKVGMLMFHRLAINEENKATEEWTFVDPATMMGQLGQMPKEAGAMRAAMEKGMDGAPMIVVAADDDKEKANLDLVKKAGDAFNTKKDAFALYADDAVESDQAGSQDAKGKKEIEKGAAMLWKAFPDFKVTYGDMFAAGDYVTAFGQFAGTNTGPLGKMKKTGKPVSGQFVEVYKIQDGKIAQTWRFRNGMTMMGQLGMLPAPKAPAGAGSAAEPAKGSAAEPAKGSAAEPAKMKKGG